MKSIKKNINILKHKMAFIAAQEKSYYSKVATNIGPPIGNIIPRITSIIMYSIHRRGDNNK